MHQRHGGLPHEYQHIANQSLRDEARLNGHGSPTSPDLPPMDGIQKAELLNQVHHGTDRNDPVQRDLMSDFNKINDASNHNPTAKERAKYI